MIRRTGVAAFVEAHIEQGPILEAEGLPLGIVTAINGATRLEVGVDGVAGHAGATPMRLRRDALTAAAEMALMIEARARRRGRSGRHGRPLRRLARRDQRHPGSRPVFDRHSLAADDARRAAAVADLEARIAAIAAERGVRTIVATVHDANAFACDPGIMAGLRKAVEAVGAPPRLLPSGAGHDTMAMGKLCPAGMLFVRCKGGVSHNPLESIRLEDCALGLAALTRFVRDFQA